MPPRIAPASRRRKPALSVLLADDHPVVREGARSILERESDIRIVAAVADGNAVLREAARLKPRVAVVDITMPGLNGIDATRILRSSLPEVAVVILTMHSSPVIVRRALDAGARGYVAKDAAAAELVAAVRAASRGERYVCERLARGLQDGRDPPREDDHGVDQLTATERNILTLVAQGKSNGEIAALAGLSPRTIETYRLRLMRKLHLDSLAALVRYAIRRGLVTLE